MIKTAAEQLLDHPLVSFLEEAGLEFVGMCSGDTEKTAAFSLLSRIQITPNKFDMRPGPRGYMQHELNRLPHIGQRQTLSSINRMMMGPQFSGSLSPFNAYLRQDRQYMNNFTKMSSPQPDQLRALDQLIQRAKAEAKAGNPEAAMAYVELRQVRRQVAAGKIKVTRRQAPSGGEGHMYRFGGPKIEGHRMLKKTASTAGVFDGTAVATTNPDFAQPSALMSSLAPSTGPITDPQKVITKKPRLKKPKKPKFRQVSKLRSRTAAHTVKMGFDLRGILLRKLAEDPPAAPPLKLQAYTNSVVAASAPSEITAIRTKVNLKKSTTKVKDTTVVPITAKAPKTITVSKKPRISALSTKGDTAMQPIKLTQSKAPGALKTRPGKMAGGAMSA